MITPPHVIRWVADTRLDRLKFARQKTAYCYFSAAATLFSPELSDARISWAKNAVLTTVVDDFFDIGASLLELENLIQLVEKYVSLSPFLLFLSGAFFWSVISSNIFIVFKRNVIV